MGRGRPIKLISGRGRERKDLGKITDIQEIISRDESKTPSWGVVRVRSQTKSGAQLASQREPFSTAEAENRE